MVAFLALAHLLAQTPVASFAPAQLKQGETITVTYRPKQKGAVVTGPEDVYAAISTLGEDWSNGKIVAKLSKTGEEWRGSATLPSDVARVDIYFFSKTKGDMQNSLSAMVYTGAGKPARCAYGSALDENYKENLARELQNYPDNLFAYRFKWFAESAYDKPHFLENIKAEWAKLEPGEHTPGFLATAIYAQMSLKDEPKARAAMKELFAKYPNGSLLIKGLSDYSYGVYSNQIKGDGPKEIDALELELVKQNPTRKDLRESMQGLAYNLKIPLETIKAACDSWIVEEPLNPQPAETLARAYLRTNTSLPEASKLIDRAVELYLTGDSRIGFDNLGQLEAFLLANTFELAADIYRANGEWSKAIGAIRTAQSLDKAMSPTAHRVEGSIWLALDNRAKATAAYEESFRRGGKDLEKELKPLYVVRKGSEEGFDEYLAGLTNSVATTPAGPPAPAFDATALDGAKLSLESLKGKVVVLNFWFIGCAPCRVEMPLLNGLVKEFAGNPDVVFIGFASDAEKDLRGFLKETPFNYHIVPSASAISSKYGISSFPGHVVIGRDGKISSQSTGGTADIDKTLKLRIQRALAGQ